MSLLHLLDHLPLVRMFTLMSMAFALSACAILVDRPARPEALSRVQPSNGPVKLAKASASSPIVTERRGPQTRPLANLPKPLHAQVITPKKRLQCVPYARRLSNIQIRGNAWTWWEQAEGRYPRSHQPKVGSVMVLKRKNNTSLGHVAYVNEIVDSRTLVVSHANWLNQGRLHNHTPVRDMSEANDWSKVRFWNTLGGHFGGNIYQPYGFIYPKQTFASR